MKIYPELLQQSEEWFRVRKGRITASNADRILTPTGKDSSQWDGYAIELVAECIRPDEPPAFIGNYHTDRGNELEPEARDVFAEAMGLSKQGFEIRQIGFLTRDDGIVGCSPDSLIYGSKDLMGGDPVAGVEIKCPVARKHLEYLASGGVPKDYLPQVHFSMAVTGLPWYFMSYCHGMVPHIVKVEPDAYTAKMKDAIDRFLIFYAERRKQLLPLATGKEAA